jgi:hypothetical protein
MNLTQVSGNPPTWNLLNVGGVGVDPDNGNIICVQYGLAGGRVSANAKVFKFDLNTFAYDGYIPASVPLICNQGISVTIAVVITSRLTTATTAAFI